MIKIAADQEPKQKEQDNSKLKYAPLAVHIYYN